MQAVIYPMALCKNQALIWLLTKALLQVESKKYMKFIYQKRIPDLN